MADVRTVVVDFLRADSDAQDPAPLRSALEGAELGAARLDAKNDPASVDAVATVLGLLLVGDSSEADVIDAAKAAAQRAPRDAKGNEVALLAGFVLWRSSGQLQLAEPYFRRVRRSEPAHPEVLSFYRELFAEASAGTQLIQVLVQARRASKEPEQRFELAKEVAALAEERLSSPERAVEMWRSVIREDGHDPRASAELIRLYRASNKWTALVDLLKDELERVEDTEDTKQQRIDMLLEIAELYRDKLKLDTMALATLQRILDIDPEHAQSLESLAETYVKAGRFNDLLGVYTKRIEAARRSGDRDAEVDLLRRVAQIWVEQLGNPQRALEPLGKVLEIAPRDPQARGLLARIHEERRDFRALIALRREDLAELEGDAALELRIELACVAEDRLGDRTEAIEAWNEVLAHHGDVDKALAALARLYEREGRWASAAAILHRKLLTCNNEQALPLLQHIGSLYSDRLRSRDDAVAVWSELLRLEPGHDKATRRLRDAYVAEGNWDELTALYASQGRLQDVVDVLQGAADRVADVDARVALYRRIASLCSERLGQPERALKALERTLAIQPDNLDVARELLPIYREQSNWARLMSTYEVLLKAAENDDERLELITAMEEVAEHKLASSTLTLHWAAAAYRLRPGDERLRERLEQAAERADGWDELTAIFEERIGRESVDESERLLLLGKLAVIARDRLYKPDDAQRYFRRIIALDPSSRDAMAALEDIYSSTKRWDDLCEVYRRRLEVTDDETARLDTLRGLAKIQEDHLSDLDGAAASYTSILELASDDERALAALANIHRNRGSWADLAAILERQLELTSSDTSRIPLMFELADINATRLGNSDRAVAGFLSVLELDGNHRATVDALETLRQSDPSTSLSVMRGLLPYYRRVDDRPKEAEAMEVIVAAEDDPKTRLEQLESLASTYEKMPERREDALRIRDQLFRADPSQWAGRNTLLRLGTELGRVQEVADAYDAALAGVEEEANAAEAEGRTLAREQMALRRDLLLEYAAILRDQLGRPEDAERAYGRVLEHDETHQAAYEALEALLQARSANEELVALYRRRVDVTFNQREQKQLLSRIIDISKTLLGDRETAVATAEELLDLIPDDLSTIELLAGMYAKSEDPADRFKLEEILGRQAELVEDAAVARAIRVRQASLRMQHLDDPFGAVDLLGQVVAQDAGDADARRLLEELLTMDSVQLQACALLDPIYEQAGDQHGKIRILVVRREHAEAGGALDDAVGYSVAAANIYETALGDPSTAFGTMVEAYLMDPTRFDTRADVERLGVALGFHAELAEVWRQALAHERMTDRALKVDLTTRLARLLDEHLRDQEGARSAYTALLALDPPDAMLAHEAVAKLCRLHLEAGDGVALIASKRELLRFCETPADRVRTLLEIASLQLELRDRVGAALTYSDVLDMQPANLDALQALEQLFIEEEEWARLGEVFEHRIGVTTEPRLRAGLWRQLGELRRKKLDDRTGALRAFTEVVQLKVGREETAHALRALIELHEELEHWPDVEENLRRLTKIADSEDVRVELLTKTAIVLGRKLNRGPDALELLKRVLDLAPTDTRARSEVSRYLEADETRERSTRILTPLYEAEQNWPALLELEELQARKQPSGRRRLEALLKVARTQEEKIGDPDKAFAVLCEAMAEAADQPELEAILEKVERLGAEGERSEALLDAYGATVDHILDSGLQQRVLRAQGEVALAKLGRLDVARGAYERVLELAADDVQAADALEQIYVRQDEHLPLAELLVRRAERSDDTEVRDGYLIRAAETFRTHLDDAPEAIRLYERLSADALGREDVQDVLEPLYERTERWRELCAHLNRKLGRISGTDAVETHLRLGRLYGQKLDDPQTGIKHLSAAIKLDPDHAVGTEELDRYLEDPSMRSQVAQMLEPVFAAVADWNRLIQIQEIRLEDAEDDPARRKILIRIAQIEEEQLEDLERAMGSYERLFKEQPTSRVVRDQLQRLSSVLEQTPRYAALLTEYAEGDGAGDDSDEMLVVVREAADLWSGTLRQPARAVPLLARIRAAKPEDGAVFSALESALTQSEQWKDLATAYWSEVDTSVSEERQLELLRKLATLSTEMLEEPEEAARAYQRMLEVKPDYGLARDRLEQIYRETQQFGELLHLLREKLDRTEDAESRGEVAIQIATLQEDPLDDPESAVDTLESLLADSPEHPDAVRMLEVIAQNRRPLRPRVLGVLRPIYESTNNLRRIVEIDEWQLGQTEDPQNRHEILREMAELQLRSPDTSEAGFRVLCRALAEPGPEETLAELDRETERVAELLDAKAGLAEALISGAGSDKLESDVDRRLALLVRGASLLAEQGDAERSAETLRSALELRDDDPRALAVFDDVLVKLGYHEELSGVLEVRARISEDDADRIALLRRRAHLLEEVLVRPADAEAVWKQLLELEPGDREALQRLSRVYEASGSTRELIDVLERQIENTSDESERRDLRMQLANLNREAVKDRSAEIDVLRSLLADVPDDDDALAALARALGAEERHAEAADVIADRAALAGSDERKATLMLEAARIYRGPLADVVSALERYEQVLGLVPGQEGALGDLVELAKSPEHFESAGNLLLEPLELVGRWEDLAAVVEARAELSDDPIERGNALRRLAQVRLERLDDAEGALTAYMALLRVVDEDGLGSVLEQAGRLAVTLGRGPAFLDELAEWSKSEDADGGTRVRVARFAANLSEEVLGESERALSVLTPLLDAGLADAEICTRIERLGRHTGDLEAVKKALVEASQDASDPAVQAPALIRLGRVSIELDDDDGALEAFRDAFEQSGDAEAIAGLEQLEQRSDGTPSAALLDALESAYQRQTDRAGLARIAGHRLVDNEGPDRARLLEQLATLREEGGGTPGEALDAWGELLVLDPEAPNALDRLLALARANADLLGPAVGHMQRAVEAALEGGNTPVPLMLQTARAQLQDVGQPAEALRTTQAILEEQPEHPEALELLVQAARKGDDVNVLHDALTRSAALAADPAAAVSLWWEAATVAESAIGDNEMALEDLEQLLAVDESDARSWQKLLALLRAASDYEKLAEALTRRVGIADSAEERRELRYRLANALVDKLDRDDDAINVYQDMLTDQPDDAGAMRELEVLLRRLERWDDVRDVCERKLELAEGDDRVVVLEELGQLAELRLDDNADAAERYQQILEERPSHGPAGAALERLLRADERWVDLSELLENKAARLRDQGDVDGYRATTSALAQLLAEKLDHPERAKELLDELLEHDPSFVPALLAKAAVYESMHEEGAMQLTLQRAADLEPQGPDGALLHLRLARLAKTDIDRKTGHLEKALALDPANVEAARELMELYRGHERWDQLVYMLELVAARTEDQEQKRALILERVDLTMAQLGDAEGALRVLAPLYKDEQEDVDINRRVADALFAAERYEEAAGMYNWLVEMGRRAKRNKTLAHHLTRLARIELGKGETANGAKDQLLEAYRIDTTNVETLIVLGQVHEQEAQWKDALKIYRTMLLQNADQSGLLRRGDIYINLARAHLALEEKPKARAMLRRGMEEDGEHPELGAQLAALDE